MIRLDIVEAQGLAGEPSYALLAVGSERYNTNMMSSINPVWEESFDIPYEEQVLITVWTKKGGRDIFLGMVAIELEFMPLDGSRQWLTLSERQGKNDMVSGEICIGCVALDVQDEDFEALEFDIIPEIEALSITPHQKQQQHHQREEKVVADDPKAAKQGERDAKIKINEAVQQAQLEIDLSGLYLTNIPDTLITYHVNWINIDLGFNRFTTIPKQLYTLSALEELWLTGNNIVSIPDDLTLPSLRVLYLNGNKLRELPESITKLVNLEKLDLANNHIIQLTPLIGNLRKLAELFLSGNPLGSVPSSMGRLDYLEILDLSACELAILPNEFPGMGRLLELNLANNQLTKLPTDFGKMSRLVSLNLSDNKLLDLPVSMGNCAHLDTVLLERNPIKDQELMRKYEIGTDHLLDYLGKKLFAQNQVAKKKQREAAKKAGVTKLREELKKGHKIEGGARDAAPIGLQTSNNNDDGFVEVVEDDDSNLTPEERRIKLRTNAQKISNDCKNQVVSMKRVLLKSNTLEEILPIAQAIRKLFPHMNVAREQMAPIPKPLPPQFFGNEDKVTQLKKTTAVAVREFETILNAILNIVSGNATLDQLIPLTGVVTGCLPILKEVTSKYPQF